MFAASGLILVLLLIFGIPAVFKLTSVILNLRKTTVSQNDPGFAPNTPRLSQNYEATNSGQIKIEGVADGKTIVELFQNENSLGTVISDDSGVFNFDISLLNGENNFKAIAVANSGKKSEPSPVYKLYYLTKPPKLDIEVKDNLNILTGATDPGASVTVNDRFVFVDAAGLFKYTMNLVNGDNKIVVIARDKAGNTTLKEAQVKSTATP